MARVYLTRAGAERIGCPRELQHVKSIEYKFENLIVVSMERTKFLLRPEEIRKIVSEEA